MSNQLVGALCRAAMHQATDPAEKHRPRHLGSPQAVGVASLRPLLGHCRALMGVAAKEPPFLAPNQVLTPKWGPVLSALDQLITKVAAMESLLEGAGLLQAVVGSFRQRTPCKGEGLPASCTSPLQPHVADAYLCAAILHWAVIVWPVPHAAGRLMTCSRGLSIRGCGLGYALLHILAFHFAATLRP